MDGGIPQGIGNLGEIHILLPDELFCPGNFHLGEIGNDAAAAFAVEKLLQLGGGNQVVPAYLFQRKGLGEPGFHVGVDVAESFVILFQLEGLRKLRAVGRERPFPVQGNQEVL